MSQRGVMVGWKSRALAALAAATLAAIGATGCSKSNATFCETEQECELGQACTNNACVAGDFDAATSSDASASCPQATHQCLPLVPADWSGPTVRAEFVDSFEPPACALLPEGALARGAGFDPSGTCECTCTTAANITCTDTTMEAVPGPSIGCSIAACAGGCLGQDISPGVCTAMVPGMLSENNVRMRRGTVVGGSCNAGELGAITPAAEFEELVALCPSEPTEGDCGESSVCAPLSPEGFTAESCIFREGLHECPAESGYSEKTITFASLDDQRSCGSCDCELPPAGTSCGGSTNSCNISGVSQTSICVASSTWNVGATAFRYDPDPNDVDCSPAEVNPALSGEVSGVDPTTVCCTAPQ